MAQPDSSINGKMEEIKNIRTICATAHHH